MAASGEGTPPAPYFQRPIALVGILLLAGVAIYGGLIYSPPRTFVSQSVETDEDAGKAVAPLGSRANPLPFGAEFSLVGGRLRVNELQRDMTLAVEAMNSFNRDPGLGEEWIIVNLSFTCDLPADQSCDTNNMLFVIEGEAKVYSSSLMPILDSPLTGLVPGGQQRNGNIGFIVQQTDPALLLVADDAITRVYFQTEAAPDER